MPLTLAPTGNLVSIWSQGIGHLLFEAEADAFLFLVHVENDHVQFLADLQNFRRMAEATPAHVRDMQQTVQAVQINERAEIRDVLDRALADVARRHLGQQLPALLIALGLDQFTAAQNDVLALLVDLDDLEFVAVADVGLEVLGSDDVELRRGQEGFHADIDDEAALDDGLDLAHDAAAFVANGEDAFPVLLEFGLLVGEDDGAFLVFELFNENIDLLTDLDLLDVNKFIVGDDAFALIADVHEDFFRTDFDDGAFDDFALGDELAAAL